MKLTPHQQQVFDKIKDFVSDPQQRVFILKGYAGTGKTTLVRFLTEHLRNTGSEWSCTLLASTGRAARILSQKTGWQTDTVHGHIYRFNVMEDKAPASHDSESGELRLLFDLRSPVTDGKKIYVVDEASMLSHLKAAGVNIAEFGSGIVLNDLFEYVGTVHKVIFIGDAVQLPPVVATGVFSPALHADFLRKHYGLATQEAELTEVMRQREGHSILQLASELRSRVLAGNYDDWEAVMQWRGEGIFTPYTQQILIGRYLERVKSGFDKGIIVTHSNKQALYLNFQIRQILQNKFEQLPLPGEVLMVSQNSYYVPLANGDQVILRAVDLGGIRKGIKFLRVKVEALHDGEVYDTLLIQDFLYNEAPNLHPDDARKLLIDFDQRARKAGLRRNGQDYQDAMRKDPYLNALRAKFGYAVTCHKSQGGEWPHCFLNLSETLNKLEPEARFRWLYTAVTRAQHFLDIKPVYKGNKPRRTVSLR